MNVVIRHDQHQRNGIVLNCFDLILFDYNYFVIVIFSILYMYLALRLPNSSQIIDGFMMIYDGDVIDDGDLSRAWQRR